MLLGTKGYGDKIMSLTKKNPARKHDLRRHKRLPARQEAQLHIPGERAVKCEIRNYCPTGLFLTFLDASLHTVIPPILGTAVRVAFPAEPGNEADQHLIDGRLAYASAHGVGLYVQAFPIASYQALKQASDSKAANPPQAVLPSKHARAIQQACQSQLLGFLVTMTQEFFGKVEKRLFQAQQEAYFMEQSRFQYSLLLLKEQRNAISTTFQYLMQQGLDALEKGKALPQFEDGNTGDELTLLDEAVFEDWLALSAVIHQLESNLLSELHHLELCFGLLSGTSVDRNNNPYGPAVICRAFSNSIKNLDLAQDIREIIYKTLGITLESLLPDLYEKINSLLEPVATFLPKPTINKNANDSPVKPPIQVDPLSETEGNETKANTLLDKLLGSYKSAQASLSGAANSSQEGMAYNLSSILSNLNQIPRGQTQARNTCTLTQRSIGNLSQTANQLQEAYRQLSSRQKTHAPAASDTNLKQPQPKRETALHELLKYLDMLPVKAASGHTGSDIPLSERLDNLLGQAITGPVMQQHKTSLDIMARLLDLAEAEQPTGSQLEPLISRLERPLLKLALADPTFLSVPGHAAKQMVDLLDQYAIAADDQGVFFDQKLHQFLASLVSRIVARADTDPAVFGMAHNYLERMLGPIRQSRRRRVALMQETSEAKERILNARLRTYEMLEQHLGGKDVPIILAQLLDLGWRHYLVLLELRRGLNHPEWQHAMAAVTVLQDWLGPNWGKAMPTGQATAEMLDFIERNLATINTDQPQRIQAFVDELATLLLKQNRDQPPASVHIPSGKLSRAKQGIQQTEDEQTLSSELKVGEWWHFYQGEGTVPMQLIWLSQPPGHVAFANRSATRKVELNLADLANRIESGSMGNADDREESLIERSEHMIIDDMYQRLSHEVSHDPVTGLLNRKGFLQQLQQLAARHDDMTHYICMLEFDQFRVIYNNCGVEAGESLSRRLRSELETELGRENILASFREETFAVLLPRRNRIQVLEIAGKLLKRLKDYRFSHKGESYSLGVSIGVAEYLSAQTTPEEAVKNADTACMMAKSAGRNRIQRYEPTNKLMRAHQSLMSWAGRIDRIVQEEGLYLRCQKIVPINQDSPLLPYYEVLLGIKDKEEEIKPMHFLPAVERWSRSHEIDMWVVDHTFDWIDDNRDQFEQSGGFAINLSSSSLNNPEVLAYLHDKLNQAGFSTDKVTFEITETSTIDNYKAAQEFIRQIRRYGCKFSIDDLGSGYSSFAHLKNLRTDSLKVDGIFVRDCVNNASDFAMVKSMNEIGHALGLKTVAEFVESPEVLDKLRQTGVDYVQGYAIHRPEPLEHFVLDSMPAISDLRSPTQPKEALSDTYPADVRARRYSWHNPKSGRLS